jgi:hypothetical protein
MKILCVIVNLLGIISFFLNRYDGRKDKVKEPSLKFWWNDNWAQLMNILVWDAILMTLLIFGGIKFDLTQIEAVPKWLAVLGDAGISAGIGLFGAYAGYMMLRRKSGDDKVS